MSTASVISIIAGVLTILGIITGFFRWVFKSLRDYLAQPGPTFDIPKKTIVLIPKVGRGTWWHMGAVSGEPAMQISGKFKVTNITRYPITLTVAMIRKPKLLGSVSVEVLDGEVLNTYSSSYAIPPGETTNLSFGFWVHPPVKEKGEIFVADIAILDQFANEHWIKRLEFKYE